MLKLNNEGVKQMKVNKQVPCLQGRVLDLFAQDKICI
jgi:hypothetical protein